MGANGVEPKAQRLGLDLRRVGVDAECGGFVGRDWLGWRCSVGGVVD
jgi:hypothetical protein